MLFLTLYRSILAPIWSEWLCDRELCALDCAVCNHDVRPVMLSVFKQCCVFVCELKKENVYFWAQKRGLKIKRMAVDITSSDELREVLSTIMEFEYLEYGFGEDSVRQLIEGKSIRHLKVMENGEKFFRGPVLRCLQSVINLDLSSVLVKLENYHTIAESAPNLDKLILASTNNLDGLSVFSRVQVTKETYVLGNYQQSVIDVKCTLRSLPQYYGSDENTPSWALRVDGVAYELIELTTYAGSLSECQLHRLSPLVERLQHVQIIHRCLSLIDLLSQKCNRLVNFVATNVNFTDANIAPLITNSTSSLTSLTVDDCTNTAGILSLIPLCSCLESLALKCVNMTFSDANCIFSGCPALSKVEISSYNSSFSWKVGVALQSVEFAVDSPSVIDESTLTVVNGCRKLVTYCVFYWDEQFYVRNPGLTDVQFKYVQSNQIIQWMTQHCPLLRSLEIYKSTGITGVILEHLSACKHLTALSVSDVKCLSNAVIDQFLSDKPYFLKLCLHECTGFNGGVVLKSITKYCRYFRRITLTHSSTVTNADAINFVNSCPTLKVLCLHNCRPMSKVKVLEHLFSMSKDVLYL